MEWRAGLYIGTACVWGEETGLVAHSSKESGVAKVDEHDAWVVSLAGRWDRAAAGHGPWPGVAGGADGERPGVSEGVKIVL